ncbi:hypothetical protein ACFE04_005621 [Oxalis oulophora]
MDYSDNDMMEADSPVITTPPPRHQSDEEPNTVVRELLKLARQHIDQGHPSEALQAVVMASRTTGGDTSVFNALHRAREQYVKRLQQTSHVDHLASLFAQCAIAELQSSTTAAVADAAEFSANPISFDAQQTSILAETGRTQIVLDAFSDGSSFICLQCGGLVSNHRKDEHYAHWCCRI